MQLQTADGPHVVHIAFHRSLQCLRFLRTQHQNHHFFSVQQGTHANGQRVLRYLIHVAVKETGVCHTGVMRQGFDTGTRSQRRSRFIKGDMTIITDTTHEQVDFTVGTDLFFILTAFGVDVRRVAVEQVDVFCWNINMVKEIAMHKAVVAFRMLFWQADIFVHIERHDVFEANLARFVHFD